MILLRPIYIDLHRSTAKKILLKLIYNNAVIKLLFLDERKIRLRYPKSINAEQAYVNARLCNNEGILKVP